MKRLFGLLVLALALTPGFAKRRHKAKHASNLKRECERGDCSEVHEDDRPNCVLKCQSEACYAQVYGAEELEPGEIDNTRQRDFTKCLSAEQRENARLARGNKKARTAGATKDTAVAAEEDGGERDEEDDALSADSKEESRETESEQNEQEEL